MSARVSVPSEMDGLVQKLVDKEDGVFASNVHAMIFAAVLGASLGQRATIENRKSGQVFEQYTRSTDQSALFELLAIFDKGDLSLLQQDQAEARVEIFEEFAMRGFQEIEAQIETAGGSVLEAILGLVLKAKEDFDPDATVSLDAVLKKLRF